VKRGVRRVTWTAIGPSEPAQAVDREAPGERQDSGPFSLGWFECHGGSINRCLLSVRTRASYRASSPGAFLHVRPSWPCKGLVRPGAFPFQVNTVIAQERDDLSFAKMGNLGEWA
jgi:hypothetical protein